MSEFWCRLTLCWQVLRLPREALPELAETLPAMAAFYRESRADEPPAPAPLPMRVTMGKPRIREPFTIDWDNCA